MMSVTNADNKTAEVSSVASAEMKEESPAIENNIKKNDMSAPAIDENNSNNANGGEESSRRESERIGSKTTALKPSSQLTEVGTKLTREQGQKLARQKKQEEKKKNQGMKRITGADRNIVKMSMAFEQYYRGTVVPENDWEKFVQVRAKKKKVYTSITVLTTVY